MKWFTALFAHGAYGVTLVCSNPMCLPKFAKFWLLNGSPLLVPSLQGISKFVIILSIVGMMADLDVDVDVAVLAAGKQ